MNRAETFADWFRRATGSARYAYQETLARTTPSVLAVPTGSGKTQALIGSWLFQRLAGNAPRRLVYALPMRSLVEQTDTVAREMRTRLEIEPDDLAIHVLMGGEPAKEGDWRLCPEASQILIGTIDMVLSRALNRGYAESRFQWPIDFGLLNNDCRWVFDEVQLMGPARATSAQLGGLRGKLGTALPCETIWASATVDEKALMTVDHPELGHVLELPDSDRQGPLDKRLNAVKRLGRLDLSGAKASEVAKALASHARETHRPGTRTIVVVNTVDRALETYRALRSQREENGPEGVLIHSRFRPPEREEKLRELRKDPSGPGLIAISTQVIEAGVDVSASTLITEPAPFSSVVQRLGRCNREGGDDEATVTWIDAGEPEDGKAGRRSAAPYLPEDISATREALLALEGESLSPSRLETVDVPEAADDPTVLRRRDLLDLFDTSPDLSGMDIDIAPFIREDDERTVSVFFRDLGSDPKGRIDDQPRPIHPELVQAPLSKALRDRDTWIADHVNGEWVRAAALSPGQTVMLAAAEGGYNSETGWDLKDPASRAPVEVIDATSDKRLEGIGGDPYSYEDSGGPEELNHHLSAVTDEVARLADVLGLERWSDQLRTGAALHDIGKAHRIFQTLIRNAIGDEDAASKLWAKSGSRGGRYERRYFRHELASALAARSLDGDLLADGDREVVGYLVAAHHGKVRLSIRPAPGEQAPAGTDPGARFALGIVDGDTLPAMTTPIGELPACELSLAPMELGDARSWGTMALRLRDDPDLGPFRLGLLEALLRIADWRASGA